MNSAVSDITDVIIKTPKNQYFNVCNGVVTCFKYILCGSTFKMAFVFICLKAAFETDKLKIMPL